MKDRIEALQEFLVSDECPYEEESYSGEDDIEHVYDNVFVVNPRQAKHGDTPATIVEIVKNIKDVLRPSYPDVDKWTSDHVRLAEIRFEQLKVPLTKARKRLDEAVRVLGRIGVPVYAGGLSTREVPLTVELFRTGKTRIRNSVLRLQKLSEKANKKAAELVSEVEYATKEYNTIQAEVRSLHCYSNIDKVIKATFNWTGTHDNERAHKYRRLVNGFYHIISDGEKNHQIMFRQAFDGDVVEDLRTSFETSDGEFLVVTDDEANELWEEDLDNYIDECLLPDLPKTAQTYFNREAFKEAARTDGTVSSPRGHSLNSYDGKEFESDDFYIYRTN